MCPGPCTSADPWVPSVGRWQNSGHGLLDCITARLRQQRVLPPPQASRPEDQAPSSAQHAAAFLPAQSGLSPHLCWRLSPCLSFSLVMLPRVCTAGLSPMPCLALWGRSVHIQLCPCRPELPALSFSSEVCEGRGGVGQACPHISSPWSTGGLLEMAAATQGWWGPGCWARAVSRPSWPFHAQDAWPPCQAAGELPRASRCPGRGAMGRHSPGSSALCSSGHHRGPCFQGSPWCCPCGPPQPCTPGPLLPKATRSPVEPPLPHTEVPHQGHCWPGQLWSAGRTAGGGGHTRTPCAVKGCPAAHQHHPRAPRLAPHHLSPAPCPG